MSRVLRVLTGAVLLAVLIGLPVAPVWCELACPQEHGLTAHAEPVEPPCHDAAAGPAGQPSGDLALTAPPVGCEHPTLVSARPPDARVVAPEPSPAIVLSHLAPLAPKAAGRLVIRAVRDPAPPRGPTFSPVLRI